MAAEALTLVDGGNATVPPNTSVAVFPSDQGKVSAVVPSYVDGSDDVQPLADANGVLVQGTATLTGVGVANASRGTVNDTTTSGTIIPANADRRGWRIRNTSSAVLYVAFGGTASATNCVDAIAQGEGTGDAGVGVYTGAIVGVWASDPNDGVAVWTEWEE